MHLTDLLTPDLVRLDLQAADKWDLLDQLAAIAAENLSRPRLQRLRRGAAPGHRIRDAVVARERRSATGIGHGCALPHARLSGLPRPLACLAILRSPIDFGSPDALWSAGRTATCWPPASRSCGRARSPRPSWTTSLS